MIAPEWISSPTSFIAKKPVEDGVIAMEPLSFWPLKNREQPCSGLAITHQHALPVEEYLLPASRIKLSFPELIFPLLPLQIK